MAPVSPTCGTSLQDEVLALRARNKILTDVLKAVKEQADEKAKYNFELVWFARNRSKYLLVVAIVYWILSCHGVKAAAHDSSFYDTHCSSLSQPRSI